jgi:hypothetical protein
MHTLTRALLVCLLPAAVLAWGQNEEMPEPVAEGAESPLHDAASALEERTLLRKQRLEGFKNNESIVVNIHITHCGGTEFCLKVARQIFRTMPQYGNWDSGANKFRDNMCNLFPSIRNSELEHVRDRAQMETLFTNYLPQVNFVALELRESRPWFYKNFPFGSPKIVSTLIIRHPIARLLSDFKPIPGDKDAKYKKAHLCDQHDYHAPKSAAMKLPLGERLLLPPAEDKMFNTYDNYAIRILGNVVYPKPVSQEHYDYAVKHVINRVGMIIDIDCMGTAISSMAADLGLKDKLKIPLVDRAAKPRDMCGNDTVYKMLEERNKFDLMLYEYAKSVSTYRCGGDAETSAAQKAANALV